jgi:hypothetical protein
MLDALGRACLSTGVDMKPRRFNFFLPSILLAGVIVSLTVPTPNVTGGGAGKMFLIIFLAVAIKVCLDYIFRPRSKSTHEGTIDKPSD